MKQKSAKFVADMLGLFMKQNGLVPLDIMRAMVVVLNPKEEVASFCEIKPKKDKKVVVDDGQLCTS